MVHGLLRAELGCCLVGIMRIFGVNVRGGVDRVLEV